MLRPSSAPLPEAQPESGGQDDVKARYAAAARLSPGEIWARVQAVYPSGAVRDRQREVALLRALGNAVAAGGDEVPVVAAVGLLQRLVEDPLETVQRYAIRALPRLCVVASPGLRAEVEATLLARWERTRGTGPLVTPLLEALQKVGSAATLERLRGLPVSSPEGAEAGPLALAQQRLEARVKKSSGEVGRLRLAAVYRASAAQRWVFRGREGLEAVMAQEIRAAAEESNSVAETASSHREALPRGRWEIIEEAPGAVTVAVQGPFSLGDAYQLRCFDSLHWCLGVVPGGLREGRTLAGIVARLTAPEVLAGVEAWTAGPWQYRMEVVGVARQGAVVTTLAGQIFAAEPRWLNDPQQAPWWVQLRPVPGGLAVELSPQPRPEPRFGYRGALVPAASHPPLAAALAWLAAPPAGGVVWDPFCGSGAELVEAAQRAAGAITAWGTDVDEAALAAARQNWAAAGYPAGRLKTAVFSVAAGGSRRELPPGIPAGGVSTILTNPPMGRRVPVADLRELMGQLFRLASIALVPGGRLVLVNPVPGWPVPAGWTRFHCRALEMGGFSASLEAYRWR